MWQALVTLLFPVRCAACKRFWSQHKSGTTGLIATAHPLAPLHDILCPECLDVCQLLRRPMCMRCGLMFKSRIGVDHRCSDCLTAKGHFGIARAVGIHQGGLKDLVHGLKYRGRLGLALPMGRMLRDTFEHYWHTRQVDLVVPIPLHPQRLRRRGFNQSALLLRAWQRTYRDTTAGPQIKSSLTILMRVSRTPPQTGLSRRERRHNIRGAFTVADRAGLKGQHLLLLDDVFTTGATVEEAARVLLAAGAASVDVLTFTRTL